MTYVLLLFHKQTKKNIDLCCKVYGQRCDMY